MHSQSSPSPVLVPVNLNIALEPASAAALRRLLEPFAGETLVADESLSEGLAEVLRCGLLMEQIAPIAIDPRTVASKGIRGVLPYPAWRDTRWEAA